MTIIDYICIAVLLMFVIASAVKGLARIVLHFIAFVISAVASRIAAAPLSDWIYLKFLHEPVNAKLVSVFPSGSIGGSVDEILNAIQAALPEKAYQIAAFGDLLPKEGWRGESFYTVNALEESFLQPIITKVLLIITTIALFTVFIIILNLIVNRIDKKVFKKRKGVGSAVNRALGGIVGLAEGAIPVAIGCMLLNLIAPLINNQAFSDAVGNSLICSFISGLFR